MGKTEKKLKGDHLSLATSTVGIILQIIPIKNFVGVLSGSRFPKLNLCCFCFIKFLGFRHGKDRFIIKNDPSFHEKICWEVLLNYYECLLFWKNYKKFVSFDVLHWCFSLLVVCAVLQSILVGSPLSLCSTLLCCCCCCCCCCYGQAGNRHFPKPICSPLKFNSGSFQGEFVFAFNADGSTTSHVAYHVTR